MKDATGVILFSRSEQHAFEWTPNRTHIGTLVADLTIQILTIVNNKKTPSRMNAEIAIALRDVTLSIGGTRIIDHISLELQKGRTFALVGQSGCGKTTILRLIMHLVEPNSGAVEFAGQSQTKQEVPKMRHRIGYVVQDGGLFPHLTARENVELQSIYLGRSAESIKQRVGELCELTQFPEEALGRYPGQISGGQRQRVGLMRALMLDPDVLLLDEPLAALDPIIRSELQADLREIFRQLGKTVVLVTHDLAEAAFVSDAIVLMRDGRVVQQGNIKVLVDQPAEPFVSAFIGAHRTSLHVPNEN